MEIVSCLLNSGNSLPLGDTVLGARIAAQGKDVLWDERSGVAVDTVVIHFSSAVNIDTPDAFAVEPILGIFAEYGVSSHYLIARDGTVWQLAPEDKKAWHCGPSIMPEPDNRQAVNDFSIGIELIATIDSGFTDKQYRACSQLCCDIESRSGKMNYVGHEDIAGQRAVALGLRAEAKNDPGPKFDWPRFHHLRRHLLNSRDTLA